MFHILEKLLRINYLRRSLTPDLDFFELTLLAFAMILAAFSCDMARIWAMSLIFARATRVGVSYPASRSSLA